MPAPCTPAFPHAPKPTRLSAPPPPDPCAVVRGCVNVAQYAAWRARMFIRRGFADMRNAGMLIRCGMRQVRSLHSLTRPVAQELTFDYKYEEGGRTLECHCGAANCRKWLY